MPEPCPSTLPWAERARAALLGRPVLFLDPPPFATGAGALGLLRAAHERPIRVREGPYEEPREYARLRRLRETTLERYLAECEDPRRSGGEGPPPYAANVPISRRLEAALGLPLASLGARRDELVDCRLWVGPRGAATPLHADSAENWVFCLVGSRRWRFFEADDPGDLYLVRGANEHRRLGVELGGGLAISQVDLRAPDHAAFPGFRRVREVSLLLREGQALYVPQGLPHAVSLPELSVAANVWRRVPGGLAPAGARVQV